MSETPTSTGWKAREASARARHRRYTHEERVAIREARRRHYMGLPPEGNPVMPKKPREGEAPTVTDTYPNPDDMSRDEMFTYLRAHGQRVPPTTKDATLRRKVEALRDGA